MGRRGPKSNDNTGKLIIIFDTSDPIGASGRGPGPGMAQGPDLGQTFGAKEVTPL